MARRNTLMTRLLVGLLRWLGILAYHLGLAGMLIRMRARYVRIVAYHHCDDRDSDFTAGLRSTISPARLATHLAFYTRHYQVVPVSSIESGVYPDRAAAITFDDGYRSVLHHAVPLLERYRMPVTVYLVPSVIGNQRMIWVNELNWLLRRHPDVARPVVARLAGRPVADSPEDLLHFIRLRTTPAELEQVIADLFQRAGVARQQLVAEAQLYLNWDEVRSMQARGVRFGNHTLTHPSLPRLDPAGQRTEIGEAMRILNERGYDGARLAYPFGDHLAETRDTAVSLGCASIMELGMTAGPCEPHRLGRVPTDAVPGEAELFALIEVVEPVKAWLKGLRGRAGDVLFTGSNTA